MAFSLPNGASAAYALSNMGIDHHKMQAKRSFPMSSKSVASKLPTNELGHLLVGKSLPLLLRRYCIKDIIAHGTFSQIFRATDTFRNRFVAVKVMRIGFDELGVREFSLLQLMKRRNNRGKSYFVQCLDAFMFEDHFCIVQELFDDTLYSSIRRVPKQSESAAGPELFWPEIHHDIHKPMLVKPMASGSRNTAVVNAPATSNTVDDTALTGGKTKFSGKIDRTLVNEKGVRVIQHISWRLVVALLQLRSEGLIHADIKPENCFFRRTSCINSNSGNTIDYSANRSGIKDRMSHADEQNVEGLNLNDIDVSDVDLRLGDFGNAIHVSEVSQYYSEFEIQSLPYRAPEVLLGLPFTAAIDMWSLGVLLAELCLGDTLFTGASREEMIAQVSRKVSPLCPVRFSGGMFSHLLSEINPAQMSLSRAGPVVGRSAAVSINFALHVKAIKRMIAKALPVEVHDVLSHDFMHFLSGLLMPDPSQRLTPQDALLHPFLADLSGLPHSLLFNAVHGACGNFSGGGSSGGSSGGSGSSADRLRGAGLSGMSGSVHHYQNSAKARTAKASADRLRGLVTNQSNPKLLSSEDVNNVKNCCLGASTLDVCRSESKEVEEGGGVRVTSKFVDILQSSRRTYNSSLKSEKSGEIQFPFQSSTSSLDLDGISCGGDLTDTSASILNAPYIRHDKKRNLQQNEGCIRPQGGGFSKFSRIL